MINTVHEDDITAWYQLSDTIEGISISDFELDEDDFLEGSLPILAHDSEGLGRGL